MYFVPWDICPSWDSALPSEIPSPTGKIPRRMLAKLFSCSCWWENAEQQSYRGLTDWKYSLKANQYPERWWSARARRSYYKATVALLTNPLCSALTYLLRMKMWQMSKRTLKHSSGGLSSHLTFFYYYFYFFTAPNLDLDKWLPWNWVGVVVTYIHVATESAGLCTWLAGTIRSTLGSEIQIMLCFFPRKILYAFCI